MTTYKRTDAEEFLRTCRLLIVDDHPTIREALWFVLSTAGVSHITEAATSGEAMTAVQRQTFELVLLDISLGGESGFDTLRAIKTLSPSLPVLIHTFHDSAVLMNHSHRLGAGGFLVKGVDTKVLVAAIVQAASGVDVWTTDQLQAIQATERRSSQIRSVSIDGRSKGFNPLNCAWR